MTQRSEITKDTTTVLSALPPLRRWKVDEYLRLSETGLIDGSPKVELLDGYITEMAPSNSPHYTAVNRVTHVVGLRLKGAYTISIQNPLQLSDRSMLEPDAVVYEGGLNRFLNAFPRGHETVLVVEVSDSSLKFDRGLKLEIYASAGVPTYWIVDLEEDQIEVHDTPGENGRYGRSATYSLGKTFTHPALGRFVTDEFLR